MFSSRSHSWGFPFLTSVFDLKPRYIFRGHGARAVARAGGTGYGVVK